MHAAGGLPGAFPFRKAAAIAQHELVRRERERLADVLRIKTGRECLRDRSGGVFRRRRKKRRAQLFHLRVLHRARARFAIVEAMLIEQLRQNHAMRVPLRPAILLRVQTIAQRHAQHRRRVLAAY
jgi:hypothetical protein